MSSASSTVLKSELLSDAINNTIFATGNDELRPIMSGVFCELSKEGCRRNYIIYSSEETFNVIKK